MEVRVSIAPSASYRTFTLKWRSYFMVGELFQMLNIDPTIVKRVEVGNYPYDLDSHDGPKFDGMIIGGMEWVVIHLLPGNSLTLPTTLTIDQVCEPPPMLRALIKVTVKGPGGTFNKDLRIVGTSRPVLEVIRELEIDPDSIEYLEIGYGVDAMTRRSLKARVYGREHLLVTLKHNS